MKINILLNFKENLGGGGYKFLNALKSYFERIGCYEEEISKANVFLFNSHHIVSKVAHIKLKYPEKAFVHRIDGPMRLSNSIRDKRDNISYCANELIADGTIFQSEWSRKKNIELGLKNNKFESVIMNAPEPAIFNRENKIELLQNRKVRIIATSWSMNVNKGFDVYKWMDENIDFNKYEIVFIGRSPIRFKNIILIPPLKSMMLASELKKSDIFITASLKDVCSNSLIEALHCGLPAIVSEDGGHPEILKNGGKVFKKKEDIPYLIREIVDNYKLYQSNIILPTINKVGSAYYDFISEIYKQVRDSKYKPKKMTLSKYGKFYKVIVTWKIYENLERLTKRKC